MNQSIDSFISDTRRRRSWGDQTRAVRHDAPVNWLLLKGLARERRSWGRFPLVLEAAIPGSRTHLLDLPGMGTERGRAPSSVAGIVEDLRVRWAPIAPGEPWSILGVSLGGMVVTDWVTRHPADFGHVVIINSSAGNLSPFHHRLRLARLPKLVGSVTKRDPVAKQMDILDLTSNGHRGDREIAEAWARNALDAPMNMKAVLFQIYAASRFRAPERLPIPSLVLTSRGDRFTDPRCSERLSKRYGSAYHAHDHAGHDLPLDAPEWIAERVKEFTS